MKSLFIKYFLFFLVAFSAVSINFAQPKPKPGTTPAKLLPKTAAPETEQQTFEKAKNTVSAAERTKNLQSFLAKFPESAFKSRALELIVSARAQEADEKIQKGDVEGGIALFELAAQETPVPVSEDFFNQVLSIIPENLYARNQYAAAVKVSQIVESKVGTNVDQLLDLAKFDLGIENYVDAKRLAKKIIDLDPTKVGAYEVLGSASTTDLELPEAADAYEKGLQLDSGSVYIKLYLANIKRALGRSDEAAALYQQILEKDPQNILARAGKILSLFDAGKRQDAETQLQDAVTANPKNLNLLTGAAYWYAQQGEGAKAIEFAQKAIAVEPRYVWPHIALARGLILQKRPAEAEREMLQAAQYGNFPTLDYELASSKLAVGLYEEAAANLRRSFTLKDGKIEVKLAGRILQSGDNFTDILAPERRASIYEPNAADSAENAKALKELLVFDLKLNDKDAKDEDLAAAADVFTAGNDRMQIFRRIYAASKLLQKRAAPDKVIELSQQIVPGIEAAVEIPDAATAVLAEEIMEPRLDAIKKGATVTVPSIQRPLLLGVLRGRVEEFAGGALYLQHKNDESIVRLRRAIMVISPKSTWWRTSQWRLGIALDTAGRSDEAFAAYSKSYVNGPVDRVKFATLQGLCQRLFNTQEGCEDKVAQAAKDDPGAKSNSSAILKTIPTPTPAATPAPKPAVNAVNQEKPKEDTATPGDVNPVVEKPTPTATPIGTPAPAPEDAAPKTEPSPTPEPGAAEKPVSNDSQKIEPATPVELKKDEQVSQTSPSEQKADTSTTNSDGEIRKRTVGKTGVVYSNPNAQVTVSANTGCELLIGDKKISLINNGGWNSLTIDLKGEGNLDDIKVTAESPEDIALELQKGIGRDIGRVMYVVRSISTKKGDFKIFVESPCGEKREMTVTVR
jgi:tetratricopeptide (TPR) repeat protein